jgi:predicted nucleic acid-binding protein
MRVFVDPVALYSALVRNDANHAAAGATLKAMLVEGAQLWTTAYGLHDMVNRLQQRVGMHAVVEFDRTYRPFLSTLWVKEEEHRTAFSRLRRRWDRELTLAQASLLVAMEEAGVSGLFVPRRAGGRGRDPDPLAGGVARLRGGGGGGTVRSVEGHRLSRSPGRGHVVRVDATDTPPGRWGSAPDWRRAR